ncbi:YfiR family protein [Cupriavidus sp. SIMBA_020]|uniref:YfiR family protein n=2 Tax=Cupriavidus TaxID=106589 RepID=A0AAE9L2M1_9BURK|nr:MULTISPECIES: YfiR family protein [Cupriavidus]TSP10149.1 YfiR family protein [Cupriavidus campinensis]URF05997.1 YfiR family protein [Cupriavidus campinensis]
MLAALLLATPRLAAHDLTPAAPALPRPEAVARVVMGLLGYARWPVERDALRLCVDPVARYAGKLMEGGALSTGRLVAARQMDPMAGNPAPDCDALYVGAMSAPRREKISADVTGHPVLVIAEEDFECDAGSMFCLNIRERQVSFRVNLDALGRSGIHVHPGVLQLGRRKAPAS